MADDIVARLQDTAYETDVCWEAAAEIERLRQLSDELYRALKMIRHDRPSAHTDEVWNAVAVAIDAWEASRG